MLKTQKIRPFKLLPDSEYILPSCFVGLTVLAAINLVLLLFVTYRLNHLVERKNTFVQLVNGEAIAVSEKEALYRHPQVIQNVVRQWASLTFDWNGLILDTQKTDPGHDLGKGQKVTTNAYFGSFLIEAGTKGFRQEALQLIAAITPTEIFSGKARSKIVIGHISPPREVATGTWEVDLISTRLIVYRNGVEEEVDFNKTFTLKAVDIPSPPDANSSSFAQRVYQIRQAGLEISKISDYQR
jgi:hypothetical protein